MNNKIIGIIGGMGPEATIDLYSKILMATHANKDQDHFRVIIDSNPKIPDRTKAILGIGESPVEEIIKTGKTLEKVGVDIACLPCITSHYFIEEVQAKLSYPILNALVELDNCIKENYPTAQNIGVLATTGTIETGLFSKYLKGTKILYPTAKSQSEKVMEAIYGIEGIKSGNKGNKPLQLLQSASNELIENGADLIISGCTEIALVLKPHHISKPLLDPMVVVAPSVIKQTP